MLFDLESLLIEIYLKERNTQVLDDAKISISRIFSGNYL